jgi:endonuclease G, mitochondrial
MGRLDAFRHIDRDRDLKDEILTRIGEDPDLIGRVLTKAAGPASERSLEASLELSGAEAPQATADRARSMIESPPDIPLDPGLEAIILVLGRPVLLVQHDDFDLGQLDTDTWKDRLQAARANLKAAIRSVGRIDLDNNPQFEWVGTGWVVAEDVIVTNRHVADVFARRLGDGLVFRTSFLGQMGARIDFREELATAAPLEFRVVEVLHIEEDPGPDMAFLRVDWSSNAGAEKRLPIQLAESLEPVHNVAVIGYPAKDSRTQIPDEMDRIFGATYNVKRLAPGDVTALLEQDRLITHDCTTLGGNSGSVVLDMESGRAMALHFAGRERDRNFAVAAPVVRARLQQLLSSGSGPSTVVGVGAVAVEAAPTLDDLEGRGGFEEDFLGQRVGHPGLSQELRDALAPVTGNDDGLLAYTHYSVRLHRFRRLAMYTAVNIDGASARNVRRGRDKWHLDPRVDVRFQTGNELYERNKLDRGHLVRRLDPAWGDSFQDAEAAALDTFFFTNCAPQHQMHNQQLWLGLEDYILSNADARDLKVSVFSGPIFRDSDRRYREFLIPEDFWKVVAVVNDETGRLSVTGYVVSQRDFMDDLEFAFGPFETYQVPVATIERQSGLDFGNLKDFDPLGRLETAAVRRLTTLEDITL